MSCADFKYVVVAAMPFSAQWLQVLLWSYPDVDRSPLALQTDHAANIFGVQFMPCTNNSQIITGAMDDTVMLHNIERLPAQLARRSNGSAVPVAFQSTLYGCHRARVKVTVFYCDYDLGTTYIVCMHACRCWLMIEKHGYDYSHGCFWSSHTC